MKKCVKRGLDKIILLCYYQNENNIEKAVIPMQIRDSVSSDSFFNSITIDSNKEAENVY